MRKKTTLKIAKCETRTSIIYLTSKQIRCFTDKANEQHLSVVKIKKIIFTKLFDFHLQA